MRQARINGAALFLLLIAGAVGGGIAIHASPTCQRFVKTYVTEPVRNRVSKTTAEAWAKWRVGHPNWKPNPKIQRPKYVMNRKEALEKVSFACEAIPSPGTSDGEFPLVDLSELTSQAGFSPLGGLPPEFGLPPASGLPPIETSEVVYPGMIPPEGADVPPFGAPGVPGGGGGAPGFFIPPGALPPPYTGGAGGSTTTSSTPVPPIVPPIIPPTIAGVPEPPSIWLVGLGVAAPWVLYGRRLKRSKRNERVRKGY